MDVLVLDIERFGYFMDVLVLDFLDIERLKEWFDPFPINVPILYP